MKRTLTIIILLFCTSAFPYVCRAWQITGRDITTSDGLPSNCVNCLAQDSMGFIWLGTNSGLCRYDGYSMTIYRHLSDKAGEYTNPHIGKITIDADSDLLRAETADYFIATLDLSRNRFLGYKERGGGSVKKTVERPSSLPADALYQCSADSLSLWLTPGGVLHIYFTEGSRKGQTALPSFSLFSEAEMALNSSKRQKVMAGLRGRLLFLGTYGNGLTVIDMTSGERRRYRSQDSPRLIPTNRVTCLLVERGGNVWIGSETAGAVSLTVLDDITASYTAYGGLPRDAALPDGNILCFFTDSRGRQWTGVNQNGIVLDGQRYNEDDSLHFFPYPGIRSIAEDQHGNIWMAAYRNGLLRVRAQEGKPLETRLFLKRDKLERRVTSVAADSLTGRLWVGSYNGIYTLPPGLDAVGSDDFDHYDVSNSDLPGNEIVCLLVAGDKLWAAVGGAGIAVIRMGKGGLSLESVITTRRGLCNDNVKSMVMDRYGYVWAGTEYGLTRVDTAAYTCSKYYFSDNIEENSFLTGRVSAKADGRLFFGTRFNALKLYLTKPAAGEKAGVPVITDILISGVSLLTATGGEAADVIPSLRGSLSLSYDQNNIRLLFSDFNYSAVSTPLYQYYMEGEDPSWREPLSAVSAEYLHLRPGSYTFHLREAGGGKETSLRIIIHQPWWNTWWAWLIYIITVTTVTWLLYHAWRRNFDMRQKMKVEKELNEFRVNFFTQVSHEFRAPLSLIQGALTRIKSASRVGETSSSAIATAMRGSKRLSKLINELMEFRKIGNEGTKLQVSRDDIIPLLRDVKQDFSVMAEQKHITLSFTSFAQNFVTPFSRTFLETIAYNLFSNAVKYTPEKGKVNISVRQDDGGRLLLTVEDSGPGIGDDRLAHLFQPFMHGYVSKGGMGIGLYLARQMAVLHHGDLTYRRSESLGGAMFTLAIPTDSSAYSVEEYEDITSMKDRRSEHRDIAQEELLTLTRPLNNITVAVIEDDADMLHQLKNELGRYFRVVGYMDGGEGCDAVSANPPALLVTDVMLPGIDGYEIVRRLRNNPSTRDMPIIILTAFDDERHQVKGYEAGADDYMVKPFSTRVLVARAAQLISWSREQRRRMSAGGSERNGKGRLEESVVKSENENLFIRRLEVLVSQHMNDRNLSVDFLAEKMHMGRTKFFGIVKRLLGTTPNKYILLVRMEKASELLAGGDLNVSEIAEKVGIYDVDYFYKVFKSYYGVSPKKYNLSS